jgi:hypothetical protein
LEKWEYKSIKSKTEGFLGGKLDLNEFEFSLNTLGEQGWELVSTFSTTQGEGSTREVISIFKRKLGI